MKFQPIDLQPLPRGEMFYYFSRMAPTGYSLTVSMDVTKLRQTLKKAGLKFFPAYLWLVTKNLNRQMEFKLAVQEETLGYFDSLTPLYATFHREEHTFFMMWTEFSDDFHVFYQHYLENPTGFPTQIRRRNLLPSRKRGRFELAMERSSLYLQYNKKSLHPLVQTLFTRKR